MKGSSIIINCVFLLVALNKIFSKTCYVYRCASVNNYPVPPKSCVARHENKLANITYYEIDTSHCTTTEYCPYEYHDSPNDFIGCHDRNTHRDSEAETTKGLDKQTCDRDVDCKSKNCGADKKCIGMKENDICEENNQCAIGNYCDMLNETTFKCKKQRKEQESCHVDLDCENDMGCMGEAGKKICVKYYSLSDNTTVFDVSDRRFCKSNYIHDNICVRHTLKSGEQCIGDQTLCEYQYSVPTKAQPVVFTRSCECSPTYFDKTYCPLATDNKLWDSMAQSYRDHYNNVARKNQKHTILRNFFPKDLILKQLEIEKYPALKDADKCYTTYATDGFYSAIKLSLLIVLSFVILML